MTTRKIGCQTFRMGNLLGRRLVVHFMVALHPSLFPFLLHHLQSQVPVLGYLHHQRVLQIRRTALLGPSSPLSRVRNMVFFELFLCYFSRLSMLFYPFTLFSLLQEKARRVLFRSHAYCLFWMSETERKEWGEIEQHRKL